MFDIKCSNCKTVVLMDGSDPPTREDLRRVCSDHKWMNFVYQDGSCKSVCPDCDFRPTATDFCNQVPKGKTVEYYVGKPDASEDWKNK